MSSSMRVAGMLYQDLPAVSGAALRAVLASSSLFLGGTRSCTVHTGKACEGREGRGGGGGHEELHRVREGWGDGGEDPGKKSNVTCLLGQAPGPPDAVGWVGYTLL